MIVVINRIQAVQLNGKDERIAFSLDFVAIDFFSRTFEEQFRQVRARAREESINSHLVYLLE